MLCMQDTLALACSVPARSKVVYNIVIYPVVARELGLKASYSKPERARAKISWIYTSSKCAAGQEHATTVDRV